MQNELLNLESPTPSQIFSRFLFHLKVKSCKDLIAHTEEDLAETMRRDKKELKDKVGRVQNHITYFDQDQDQLKDLDLLEQKYR